MRIDMLRKESDPEGLVLQIFAKKIAFEISWSPTGAQDSFHVLIPCCAFDDQEGWARCFRHPSLPPGGEEVKVILAPEDWLTLMEFKGVVKIREITGRYPCPTCKDEIRFYKDQLGVDKLQVRCSRCGHTSEAPMLILN